MCVNMIAGSSAWLTAYYRWGGTCTNVFGVETVTSQWAEWLTLAPLLAYLTIAVEDREQDLDFNDFYVIASMFFCILLGTFFFSVPGPYRVLMPPPPPFYLTCKKKIDGLSQAQGLKKSQGRGRAKRGESVGFDRAGGKQKRAAVVFFPTPPSLPSLPLSLSLSHE